MTPLLDKIKASLEIEAKRTQGKVIVSPMGHPKRLHIDKYLLAEFYANGKVAGETENNTIFYAHAANTFKPYLQALERAVEGIERERGMTMKYTFKWNALTDILNDIEKILEGK